MSPKSLAFVAAAGIATVAAIAVAQDLVQVGTMSGTVDGAPFELVISEGVVEGVTIGGAYWNPSFLGGFDVTILGQTRPSLFSITPGAMLLDFGVPEGPCPCAAHQVSLFFSPEGGFTSNVYDDLSAEATIEAVEELEPGVYRIVGSFEAVLGLKEGVMDRPDPERTVHVVGTFVVDRLAEEEDVP